jgi:hypothetical protein
MAKAVWPVCFVVLANAPGRYAMAARDRQFGGDMASTFVLAVLADVACLAPACALSLVLADWIAMRRPETRTSARRGLVAGLVTVVLVSAFMWAVSVAATEFRIQRGSYPTMVETMEGLGDLTFIRGSAKIALFERYSWPTFVAFFAWAGALVGFGWSRPPPRSFHGSADGRARPYTLQQGRFSIIARPLGALAEAGIAAGLFLFIRAMAPAPISSGLLPPIVRLAADVAAPRLASRQAGVRAVLESNNVDETLVRSGLHWLGFGDSHARCLLGMSMEASCAPHPLARPLPGDAANAHVATTRNEEPTPLVRAFLRLSTALFEQRDTPLVVWHVALESFRADDVHALNPAAPAQIAPFLNAAYEEAPRRGPRTIAFRHAFQAGLRTAQAVSGLWCGLGALPFQLAVSRDLVDLPLRCAPDLLRDAGFKTHLHYGSNASFEQLGEFANRHGMAVTDLSTLPAGLPRGAFGAVTDAALLRVALQDSANGGSLAYRFVLTLSGHSPFDVPGDMPPATESTIDAAIHTRGRAVFAEEDRRRLMTMAYTDGALAAFVQNIERSPNASATILLVSADHATADPFLWGHPTAQGMAKVPLFFYFPAAFIAVSKDVSRIDEELRALADLASTHAVSINDVPTLLFALLASHPAMFRLDVAKRWHTLGGATSSPNFAGRTTAAQVWGIDALSRVFLVRRDAVDQLVDSGERSVAFSVWDEPLGPLLKDVTGALSTVLRVCSTDCGGSAAMRTCCMSSRQSVSR